MKWCNLYWECSLFTYLVQPEDVHCVLLGVLLAELEHLKVVGIHLLLQTFSSWLLPLWDSPLGQGSLIFSGNLDQGDCFRWRHVDLLLFLLLFLGNFVGLRRRPAFLPLGSSPLLQLLHHACLVFFSLCFRKRAVRATAWIWLVRTDERDLACTFKFN